MHTKWRRLRTVVTILMTLIGAGLVAVAWFSVGVVPGEAVVDLAFLGVVLPLGFYTIFTLVGWQRSTDSGIAPNRLIALCLRFKLGMVAPIAFMFFLIGFTQSMSHALDRPVVAANTFDAGAMRRGCVSGISNQVRAKGGDVTAAQTRIDSFCGCVTMGVQTAFSATELQAWSAQDNPLQDPKYGRVVQQCQKGNKA